MKNLKVMMMIAVCLLPTAMVAQTVGVLPQGLWKVAQVTIEKNTDGNLQTTVYNTAEEVQANMPCPQEWEIRAENVTLRYANAGETTVAYELKGNKLTMATLGAIQTYEYSTSGEYLFLTTTHKYGRYNPEWKVENIEEKWTISLKK